MNKLSSIVATVLSVIAFAILLALANIRMQEVGEAYTDSATIVRTVDVCGKDPQISNIPPGDKNVEWEYLCPIASALDSSVVYYIERTSDDEYSFQIFGSVTVGGNLLVAKKRVAVSFYEQIVSTALKDGTIYYTTRFYPSQIILAIMGIVVLAIILWLIANFALTGPVAFIYNHFKS